LGLGPHDPAPTLVTPILGQTRVHVQSLHKALATQPALLHAVVIPAPRLRRRVGSGVGRRCGGAAIRVGLSGARPWRRLVMMEVVMLALVTVMGLHGWCCQLRVVYLLQGLRRLHTRRVVF
jgi:hypothetical protein